jgi:hypothetical protein
MKRYCKAPYETLLDRPTVPSETPWEDGKRAHGLLADLLARSEDDSFPTYSKAEDFALDWAASVLQGSPSYDLWLAWQHLRLLYPPTTSPQVPGVLRQDR